MQELAYGSRSRQSVRLSDLIGKIYDAALNSSLWIDVLHNTTNFVGGTASALFIKDSARKTMNVVYSYGYDQTYTETYLKRYVPLDPFTTGQFFFPLEEPVCLADLVPDDEFKASRFYLEWVRPQRWIDALGITLEKTATTYAALAVIRHEDQGIVDDETRRRAKLIAPHFRRAVTIGRIIDLHKGEIASLVDALDGFSASLLLVDAGCRIVHANLAAHSVLDQGSIIRATGGKLLLSDPEADQALRDIVARAEAGDLAVGAAGIALPLLARDGTRYVAHILPLTSGARRKAHLNHSAVAAVFVREAKLELPHPIETIARAFNLTATEMRVLMLIAEVGGVPEVASDSRTFQTQLSRHICSTYSQRPELSGKPTW